MRSMTNRKRNGWVTSKIAKEDKSHQLPNSAQIALACVQYVRPARAPQHSHVRMRAEDTCSQPGQCGQPKARLDHTILQLKKIP